MSTSTNSGDGLCNEAQRNGDSAVRRATLQFDKRDITTAHDDSGELAEAADRLSLDVGKALDIAIERVTRFNQELLSRTTWQSTNAEGDLWGEFTRPVESAGLFVPSRKGAFPSVTVQIAVPARVVNTGWTAPSSFSRATMPSLLMSRASFPASFRGCPSPWAVRARALRLTARPLPRLSR